jgi:hypothetical protein
MLQKTVLHIISFHRMQLLMFALLIVVCSTTTGLAAGPSISGFTPKKGAVGDNVIINGEGFVFINISSNKVRFSGKRAIVAVAPTATRLVVTIPDEAISGQITIDNTNGSVTSSDTFEVIAANNQIESSGRAPGPGDRKILNTYMSGFKMTDIANSPEYYASPGSILWVDSKVDDKGTVIVHFAENWTNNRVGAETIDTKYKDKCKGGLVIPRVKYTVKATELQNTAAQSQGPDYGLLVVPFKFHPSDHSLTGEATLGGYAGYQYSWPGIAITVPVVSAGIGVVNITQQNGTTSTSSSAPSLSIAYGIIINLVKSGLFQIGVISGFDWAGKGSQYKYEGKPWISVSFGTNFTK